MNHLIIFGVCALAGCTNFINLQTIYNKDMLKAFFMFKFDALYALSMFQTYSHCTPRRSREQFYPANIDRCLLSSLQ